MLNPTFRRRENIIRERVAQEYPKRGFVTAIQKGVHKLMFLKWARTIGQNRL